MRVNALWPGTGAHPSPDAVAAVLDRVPDLTERELRDLADGFGDGMHAATARARALDPDLPWILDVLQVFDICERLYAGEPSPDSPELIAQALRGVRDAVAAAYAQPVLRRADHAALMRPWRHAVRDRLTELPPAVQRALGELRALPARCHDPAASARWNELALIALGRDSDEHRVAVESAHVLAVAAGREMAWQAVRRCATEAISRRCTACGTRPDLGSLRVLALAVDASCGLLVSDLVAGPALRTLSLPLLDWLG